MPSLLHEVLVELFQRRGDLAPDLLRRATRLELAHARTEVTASGLTQIVPVEYRADAVIKLYAADGQLTAAVIVEVQLHEDRGKHFTWPLYVAALRERLRCPVHLLVVARNRKVACWARQPIALGPRGFELQPAVISLPELRAMMSLDAARVPEIAALSMLAQADPGDKKAILAVIEQLRENQPTLYCNQPRMEEPMLDLASLDMERMKRDLFELHIETTAWQGRLEALRTAVLALARAKLGGIDDEQQARIGKLFNEHELHHLITALGLAASAAEARTALDRAIFLPSHARHPR